MAVIFDLVKGKYYFFEWKVQGCGTFNARAYYVGEGRKTITIALAILDDIYYDQQIIYKKEIIRISDNTGFITDEERQEELKSIREDEEECYPETF